MPPGASGAPPRGGAHQGVRVQEDALPVARERPAVQLGQGDAELRPPQEGQVHVVGAVDQVHLDHLIEHLGEDEPAEDTGPLPGGRDSADLGICAFGGTRGRRSQQEIGI